jgi:hypothetical protein
MFAADFVLLMVSLNFFTVAGSIVFNVDFGITIVENWSMFVLV